MQIVIRNYRAIEYASLALDGITLVAGPNGSGKTSTAEALAALLTRTAMVTDGVLIKDAAAVVRDGEKEATADLQHGKGETDCIIAAWPKAKLTGDLAGAPASSMIAAGMVRVSLAKKLADRVTILTPYISGTPDDAEVKTELQAIGYNDESVTHAMKRLAEIGWDAMHTAASDNSTALRGRWEGITNEAFGASKADGWAPEGWREISVDVVAAAQADYDEAVGERAVVMERLPKLQEQVAKAEGIDVAAFEETLRGAEAALADAEAALAALGSPDDGLPCPHCGGALLVRQDHATKHMTVVKATAAMSPAEVKALRLKIAEADGTVHRLRSIATTAKIDRDVAKATVATAEAARQEIASLDDVDVEKVTLAKNALDTAQRRAADGDRVAKAAGIYANWVKNKKLVDLLAPDGLRRRVMARSLAAFNAKLADLCDAAGWPAVEITADFGLAMGGRPYHLLSKSTQFRADVTVQIACAQIDGSRMLVIDGADILDKSGRNGLFKALAAAALPALVTMTFSAPDLVPKLAAAGMGHSYWLTAGRASDIEDNG